MPLNTKLNEINPNVKYPVESLINLKENHSKKIRENSFKNSDLKYIYNQNEIEAQSIDSNKLTVEDKKDTCYFREQVEIKFLHLKKNKTKLNIKDEVKASNLQIISLILTCSWFSCSSKKSLMLKSNMIEVEKKLDFNFYFKHLLEYHFMKQILFNKEQLDLLEYN